MTRIPPTVQKPSRYSGCEARRPLISPAEAKTRVLLAFPDVYEIGMSHLGMLLLHDILNDRPGTLAERAFAPWADMEAELRGSGTPLFSLESGTPARDFDIVGFSLCYELTYTNVLLMLDLAGIPRRSAARGESDPIVLGGGVCTLNPAPVAPFFDALLVGDGEEAVLEIVAAHEAWKDEGAPREALLRRLAAIAGVFVPGVSAGVSRRILPDMARSPLIPSPILPAMRVVHDRLSIEISRGCTRGCRFCQAGYVYRPVRERDPALLLRHLQECAGRTGYDEVGLLSLSAADYGSIDRLITEAMETLSAERVSVSLPSIRLDALQENTVRQIKKVRKTGFTLAPEAGTDRLRRSINKGITDEELLRAADTIYGNGWQTIKLYFMLGLPGETEEDVRAIGELVKRVAAVARRHGKRNSVTASLSTFIPKPHTPFQWEPQISPAESQARVAIVKGTVGRDRNADVKYNSPEVSELEGVFSRGDARLADAIEEAYLRGARFDAWTETFSVQRWRDAFAACGIDHLAYLEGRDPDGAPLPWEFVDAGLDRNFLLAERARSLTGESTPDCRSGECSACGVCGGGIANVTYRMPAPEPRPPESPAEAPAPAAAAPPPEQRHVIRIRFSKEGAARYLSGLELQSIWARVLRRAGMPVAYSRGFHPQPRLSFSPALPVGTESDAEFVEAELTLPVPVDRLAEAVPPHLPAGIRLLDARRVPPLGPFISDFDLVCEYRIVPDPGASFPPGATPDAAESARAGFLAAAAFPILSGKEGKQSEIDLRKLVSDFRMIGDELSITIVHGTGKGVRPLEAASALFGVEFPPSRYSIRKVTAEPRPRLKK
jgi:radical SAM-linked protein